MLPLSPMLMAKQVMALGYIGLARIWKAHSVHVSHPYNRRSARLLVEMEKVKPIRALIDLMETHCSKTSVKCAARLPYLLATMLWIHLSQQW
jgi:hypothetical protein